MRDKYLLGSHHHIACTCPSTAFPFICNHRALDPGSQKLMPLDLQWGEASAWKGIFQISINTANVTSTKKRATAEAESVVQLTGISTLNHHFVTINTVSFVKIHRVLFLLCVYLPLLITLYVCTLHDIIMDMELKDSLTVSTPGKWLITMLCWCTGYF